MFELTFEEITIPERLALTKDLPAVPNIPSLPPYSRRESDASTTSSSSASSSLSGSPTRSLSSTKSLSSLKSAFKADRHSRHGNLFFAEDGGTVDFNTFDRSSQITKSRRKAPKNNWADLDPFPSPSPLPSPTSSAGERMRKSSIVSRIFSSKDKHDDGSTSVKKISKKERKRKEDDEWDAFWERTMRTTEFSEPQRRRERDQLPCGVRLDTPSYIQ